MSDKNTTFLTSQGGYLNGAPKKLSNLCNFFIEDIPTSFSKDSLTAGGQDVVLYTGLQGTVGTLIPIQTKNDIRFFNKLQKALRLAAPDLLGRDHLKFRSYYQPVKNVIDGDLIESFNEFPIDVKVRIGKEIGKLPKEISRKIFEMRALST
jgi:splicing factor 3B subunit 3